MENDTTTNSAAGMGARAKEYFSVRLAVSGSAQAYEDPREAGAAFFHADPAERPSVTHIDGETARIMARTTVAGTDEAGEPRYGKSLPDSHAPDAAFRAGFHEAMEISLAERLGKAEREAEGKATESKLDARTRGDLEALAAGEPGKAAALWAAHSGDIPPGPGLKSAVAAAEAEAERDGRAVFEAANEARPNVIATTPWVRTDLDVEIRGVAVATEKGIHTGYEASRDGGESTVTHSEMTLSSARAALRHAFDFYEGDEKGLETAVKQRAEIERELSDDGDTSRITRELPDDDPRPAAASRVGNGHDTQSVPMSRVDFQAHVEGWIERVGGKMRDLSAETQAELRPAFNDVAASAMEALGDKRAAELAREEPKSALYRSVLSAPAPVLAGEEAQISSGRAGRLREALGREAEDAGLDGAAVAKRIGTGAANALEERNWVKADIASVATSKGLDLGREADRTAAASIVDSFYEKASAMLNVARGVPVENAASELRQTLGAMVKMEARQGQVRFESDADAKGLVDDIKARYGETIIADLAKGKTDALAKDYARAGERAKIADAVTSAARDHEPFGLSRKEAEAAHERLTRRHTEDREPSRDRETDRER